MDILVTGGAGFIGGHLAETFAENGHDVVVFDHFEPYYDLGIKEHNVEVGQSAAARSDGSYEFVRGSTTDADLVDVVYHQAAQAACGQANSACNATATVGCCTSPRTTKSNQTTPVRARATM